MSFTSGRVTDPERSDINLILVLLREYHEARMLSLPDSARAVLGSWDFLPTVEEATELDRRRAHRVLSLLAQLPRGRRARS